MDDVLIEAATQVWTAAYGPKYPLIREKVDLKHKGGNLLIASKGKSEIELWRMDYGADFPVRHIDDKSSCGNNSATFLLDKYYRRDLGIEKLLPLIAHCIIMGGHMNPTGVDDLEIATWAPVPIQTATRTLTILHPA